MTKDTRLEDIDDHVRLADHGEHQIGNIIIAIGKLVDIVEEQSARIAALEAALAEQTGAVQNHD